MLKNKWLPVIITLLICVHSSIAQILVSNTTELENAIGNAVAGDEIVLKSQVWTDVVIDINATGTLDQPIIIRTETTGGVSFEGNSSVHLGGSYLILDGIIFQNASNLEVDDDRIDPIIEFRDLDKNECDHCSVINVKIDSYNGTSEQEEATFKWIILYGQYNEISYSSFLTKNGVGSIINDNRNDNDANYNKIHHNYFADRTPVGDFNDLNDQDAIRIGNSSTSLSDSFTEVYNNYFENFSGEIEIISNKSGANKYYNNTFRDYQGSLTLRHGNACEVYNNYFFAEGNNSTAGIRVIGENHLIYNNYIEGINSLKDGGSSSGATGGINVTNGRENTELSGYYQVIGAKIVNNTFVDCDFGIRIGTKVQSDLTLAPEDLEVSNNIFLNSSTEALRIETTPVNTTFQGNITQSGGWDLTTDTNGNIEVESGLMEEGTDFYRIADGSAAVDAGMGTYDFLALDVLGGSRETAFDAGAEEFGADGTNGPYTSEDVGVTVGFGADGEVAPVLTSGTSFLEFGKVTSSSVIELTSNVDWTISTNVSWLTLSSTSGSTSSSITVTVEENTDGAERNGVITIEETNGDLSLSVNVTQFNEDILNLNGDLMTTGISVYPNPINNGQLNIDSDGYTINRIRLFDLGGKVVIDTFGESLKTSLDVSQLKPGLYILNLAELGSTKIVIQ